MEHPALEAAMKRLSGNIRKLQPDPGTGRLIPAEGDEEIAVFHLVQSETGVIQDTERLFSSRPDAVHVLDAVQAAGKLPLPLKNTDIAVVSGNKFGAPGCAALLLNPDWEGTEKMIRRYEEERSGRYLSGRITPAAVFACVHAAGLRMRNMQENLAKLGGITRRLRQGCMALGLKPTIPEEYASPYILHLTAPGYQGGVLVRMLAEEGIMVSSGSACASETKTPSPALTALGFSRKDAFSGLRFSPDIHTAPEEADFLLSSLEKVLKKY